MSLVGYDKPVPRNHTFGASSNLSRIQTGEVIASFPCVLQGIKPPGVLPYSGVSPSTPVTYSVPISPFPAACDRGQYSVCFQVFFYPGVTVASPLIYLSDIRNLLQRTTVSRFPGVL